MIKNENKIILYQDESGLIRVSVRFADEDLWLTQNQIAEIYDTTQPNISMHIDNIFKAGELQEEATHKKFLLVRREGNRDVKREIDHYNLDMIIASHEQAMKKAEYEFELYREREMKQLESDFDRMIKMLNKRNNDSREK